MSEQAEFDPNETLTGIDSKVDAIDFEEQELPEELQEEALKLSLEEFHEGVMSDEHLMVAVIGAVMKEAEIQDMKDLPDLTIRPYMLAGKDGKEMRGLQILLSAQPKLDELPELGFTFGRLVHVGVTELDPQAKPSVGVSVAFAELIVGHGLSKEDPPTKDENDEILAAARKFHALLNAFTDNCENRGVRIGIDVGGTPELISKLEGKAYAMDDEFEDHRDQAE